MLFLFGIRQLPVSLSNSANRDPDLGFAPVYPIRLSGKDVANVANVASSDRCYHFMLMAVQDKS